MGGKNVSASTPIASSDKNIARELEKLIAEARTEMLKVSLVRILHEVAPFMQGILVLEHLQWVPQICNDFEDYVLGNKDIASVPHVPNQKASTVAANKVLDLVKKCVAEQRIYLKAFGQYQSRAQKLMSGVDITAMSSQIETLNAEVSRLQWELHDAEAIANAAMEKEVAATTRLVELQSHVQSALAGSKARIPEDADLSDITSILRFAPENMRATCMQEIAWYFSNLNKESLTATLSSTNTQGKGHKALGSGSFTFKVLRPLMGKIAHSMRSPDLGGYILIGKVSIYDLLDELQGEDGATHEKDELRSTFARYVELLDIPRNTDLFTQMDIIINSLRKGTIGDLNTHHVYETVTAHNHIHLVTLRRKLIALINTL